MMTNILTLIVAIVTLVMTIYIPKKLAWEQYYNSLIIEYRSMEFGKAMQSVILFYTETCGKNVTRIYDEYEKRYIEEVLHQKDHKTSEDVLHFQRRLLAQFFLDLEKCANTPFYFIGKARVQNDFTTGTKNLVKILYFMDLAVNNPNIYADISCEEKIPKSSRIKGMNKHLCHMYEILKESKDYIL